MAEAAFDETLGYAKHTVPAEADDEALRASWQTMKFP